MTTLTLDSWVAVYRTKVAMACEDLSHTSSEFRREKRAEIGALQKKLGELLEKQKEGVSGYEEFTIEQV